MEFSVFMARVTRQSYVALCHRIVVSRFALPGSCKVEVVLFKVGMVPTARCGFQGKVSRKFGVHAKHQSLTRHVLASHAVRVVVSLQRAVVGWGFAAGQVSSSIATASQPSNSSFKPTREKPRAA